LRSFPTGDITPALNPSKKTKRMKESAGESSSGTCERRKETSLHCTKPLISGHPRSLFLVLQAAEIQCRNAQLLQRVLPRQPRARCVHVATEEVRSDPLDGPISPSLPSTTSTDAFTRCIAVLTADTRERNQRGAPQAPGRSARAGNVLS
jgi:hypothetical protein